MSIPVTDITIAGAGPAGLALAASLADRGVKVIVVDPDPEGPRSEWPNRYGGWADEVTAAGLPIERVWQTPYVDLGQGEQVLRTPYAWIDREAARRAFVERLMAGGGEWVQGRVVLTERVGEHRRLHLADGRRLDARYVVDATGRGVLVDRPQPPRAFQAALGRVIRAEHPWSMDRAAYMDFSDDHLDAAERQAGPATFLYALPLDAEHVFVEETSLAAAPAVPLDALERRLDLRLAAMGIRTLEVLEHERCLFAMDAAPPVRAEVLAVGSSAGWVHPATGYQVVRAVRRADPVADALVQALSTSPEQGAALAWRAIWPTPELRTRALHDLGLSLLLDFEPDEIRAFFLAFFSIPDAAWRSYLDATSPPRAIAGAMTRVFAALPSPLQGTVLRHATGRGRSSLLRALTLRPLGGTR